MYQHLVVAVDGSKTSLNALQHAAELADASEAAKAAGVADVQAHLLVTSKGAKEMAQELVDYADSKKADLLVLGTHGRSGLMHLLMGSFAETLMRQSHLPLLVIRSTHSEEGGEGE